MHHVQGEQILYQIKKQVLIKKEKQILRLYLGTQTTRPRLPWETNRLDDKSITTKCCNNIG